MGAGGPPPSNVGTAPPKLAYPVDVDGGEHVLEHAGHQFDLDLLETEIAEDQQRVVGELLLVHAVPLEGRDHVLDQRVLAEV